MTHHVDNPSVPTDTSAPTASPAHVAGAHTTPGIVDRLGQAYITPTWPLFSPSFRRLREDNWLAWKMRMRIALEYYDAHEIVVDSIPKPDDPASAAGWRNRDAIAQQLIVMNLRDKDLVLIHDCNTAAEMWNILKIVYERLGQWSLRNTRRTRRKKKAV